jgi:hypothetical protein
LERYGLINFAQDGLQLKILLPLSLK